MSYPLDSAIYQWEDGYSRLRELSGEPRVRGPVEPGGRGDPRRAAPPDRPDLLRRPSSPTSTAGDRLVPGGGALRAVPEEASELDPQAIIDGAFYLYLRGAIDWAGGRLHRTE